MTAKQSKDTQRESMESKYKMFLDKPLTPNSVKQLMDFFDHGVGVFTSCDYLHIIQHDDRWTPKSYKQRRSNIKTTFTLFFSKDFDSFNSTQEKKKRKRSQ